MYAVHNSTYIPCALYLTDIGIDNEIYILLAAKILLYKL